MFHRLSLHMCVRPQGVYLDPYYLIVLTLVLLLRPCFLSLTEAYVLSGVPFGVCVSGLVCVVLRDSPCKLLPCCHPPLICIPDSTDLLLLPSSNPHFLRLSLSPSLSASSSAAWLTSSYFLLTFLFSLFTFLGRLTLSPSLSLLSHPLAIFLSGSILCVLGIQRLPFLDKHPVSRIIPVVLTM